jgi:hypothetical protein
LFRHAHERQAGSDLIDPGSIWLVCQIRHLVCW